MVTLFRDQLESLSRREFLKLFSAGLLGAFLISEPFTRHEGSSTSTAPFGRIVSDGVELFKKPTYASDRKRILFKDLVLPITSVVIGDATPPHNRIWYELNYEGYVHSGSVQPVDKKVNDPVNTIQVKKLLGEITVPFSDALWFIHRPSLVAYRLYFGTTYWVSAVKEDYDGNLWYRIYDDKWKYDYYVNGRHMRLIPDSDLGTRSSQVKPEDKRIDVSLSQQAVIAYENEKPVFMSLIATGAHFSDGDFSTPQGSFMTHRKRPSRHMAAGDRAAANSYDLPGVPWVCYLTEDGVSFHGTYWHNDFGKTRSHGCINLPMNAARWLFLWTLPHVPIDQYYWSENSGTKVHVI
jgi:hypothetical protein